MSAAPLQWQVVRAQLDPDRGSEQSGVRPVQIVSREVINRALPIVAVLPMTSARPGRRVHSTEVLLPAGAAGQPEDSVVTAHQVRALSIRRLGRADGTLDDGGLRAAVRGALRVFLDLE